MKPPRVVLALLISALGLSSQLLAAPTIDTQPSNATVVIGASTTFTVAATASGGTLTYQWQGFDGIGWGNLSNSTPFANVMSATLNVNAPAYGYNGGKVRCAVTDLNGTTYTDGLATLTITTPAPILILANPTNKSAFQGDVGTTFEILATGTGLTYQWQLSTDNGATWPTNLTDTGAYSGTATATLTIADPYANLGGATGAGTPRKYRCLVTSGTYVIASRPAALNIYVTPATPPVVSLLVDGTPASSIVANDPSPITVQVSGIATGGTVRINRFLDQDGSGTIDHGEPLVQSFTVTDGAVTSFGGVVDPNIPGDTDPSNPGVVDPTAGTINASFTLAKAPEMARGAGNSLFRVVSPTGAFRTVTSPVFTVTQPTLAYTVSGTVNVPFAQVALLRLLGNDDEFTSGAMADGSGNFTLPADPGTYMVLALAPGYVTSMATPTMATVTNANVTGADVTLTAAQYMNSFALNSAAGGLRGVQIFFESDNNYITIANTNNNGVADAAAVPASWAADVSSISLEALGYVRPQSDGGVPLNGTNTGIQMQAANALIWGALTDDAATPVPLANVNIWAGNQSNTYSMDTMTDASGHYYIAVLGSDTPGTFWNLNVDTENPLFGTSYSLPQPQSAQVISGNAYNLDLVAPAVTAHLSGTVTNADNSNLPVSGAEVDLYSVSGFNSNYVTSVTTGADGAFSFGVTAGSWRIGLNPNYARASNLVGPVLSYPTVTDGNNVTGIALVVRNSTGTISGTVTDFNNAPMSNANVVATATIDLVTYGAGAQTDGSGNYSFPVINGDWTVNVYTNLVTPPQTTTVSGSATLNFSPTVFFFGPNDQSGITAGTQASFGAGINYDGISAVSMVWRLFSGTWGNIPDAPPYFGVTGSTLNINPASVDMSGNQYRLAVTFTYNAQQHTEYSTAATLTVSGSAPNILGQPSSQTITAGGGTSFGFSVDGTPAPTYQWKYSLDNGATFAPLGDGGYFSGTQTNTLVVNNADTTISGWQFNCIATNGVGTDAVSDIVTLTVNAASQTVTFNGLTLTKDLATTLSATATSGLTNFNYSVQSSTTIHSLVGDQLTITGVGTVTVRAEQPGDPYYSSAFADATFTVNKLPATVNLINLTATYDGNPKSASATTSPEGLTVSFTYNGSGTPPTDAGSYEVIGTISDATYQGSSTGTFTINKADQTINFTNPGTQTYSATPITLSATGGASGIPVTFSWISGPATLSGTNNSTLTMTGTGFVTIRASQAASANYNAAPDVDQSFEVTEAASGFDLWRAAKFTEGELADLNISGPNAVYGQDGLPNLVKYALGLEPKQNITTGLPTVSKTATDWVYTYSRPDSVTDVTYVVEYSTNLTTWTPLSEGTPGVSSGGMTPYTTTYPLSATNIFFRLNVSLPAAPPT